VCTEWLKVNGQASPHGEEALPAAAKSALKPRGTPLAPQRDLFGNPVVRQPAAETDARQAPAKATQPPMRPATADFDPDRVRGFTTEDIESFKALNVEVCLENEQFGDVWIVPRLTSANRVELLPEHAATLFRVLCVFPRAPVARFERRAIVGATPTTGSASKEFSAAKSAADGGNSK
jgi:hypothetical protein